MSNQSSYSYPVLESIWANEVRLTRATYSNLQDEIEYLEDAIGVGCSRINEQDLHIHPSNKILSFPQTTCSKCNKKFKVGDNIVFKIIGFNEEDNNMIIIPMHLECTKINKI